jgi:hypothetical protein
MQYEINELNSQTLSKLYTEFHLRSKEIGEIFGITEDAVLKRLKGYNIPIQPRGIGRVDVEIQYTGLKKNVKNGLTPALLREYCDRGLSDLAIGNMFGMTGEGVAYRRKKLGINRVDKFNITEEYKKVLLSTPVQDLENDYINLATEDFSSKYNLSKTVWLPYIRSIGILSKAQIRIASYPQLTQDQRWLIFGGLLGDAGISDECRYYESHALKQEKYLRMKYRVLNPYSTHIFPCDGGSGLRMYTIIHPAFDEFRNLFYQTGLEGKLIPVKSLIKEWDDIILAYWFFDDGTIDDEDNSITIANKCPIPAQLDELSAFLEGRYGWGFNVIHSDKGVMRLTLSKTKMENFGNLLKRYSTTDLYYKIPEICLTGPMVAELNSDDIEAIKPKFYRLADLAAKVSMEKALFNYLRKKGFPYLHLTEQLKISRLKSYCQSTPLKRKGNVLSHNTAGLPLVEGFFPNLYDCYRKGGKAPSELWGDDEWLRVLVKNRLEHADRITDAAIRTGIKLTRTCVNNFKPAVADYVYRNYCSNQYVYDYSCGFGSRMLAAMRLGKTYVGCEPNLETLKHLKEFGSFLKNSIVSDFTVLEGGSEDYCLNEPKFGVAFSSPPFFDFEHYSNDPNQSIIKYPSYEDWLIGFWKKTIENSIKMLVPGGYFGACISLHSHEDMLLRTEEYCIEFGFHLKDFLLIPFQHVWSDSPKFEVIIIFSMGAEDCAPKLPKILKKLV